MKMSCTANIARQFGVAKTTVSSIRLGRTWSNL